MELEKLKEPFTPRWKKQFIKKGNAVCVPYVDARDAQQRFDDVCGTEGWQNTYDPETGAASIGIFIKDEWVWKTDVGSERDPSDKLGKTEQNAIKVKSKASDAFKRAAVLWGVGRHLYSMGEKVLATKGYDPITSKGTPLYTNDQITNYINGLNESQGLILQLVKQEPELAEQEKFQTLIKELYDLVK